MNLFSRALDRFCYKHPRFGIPNLMRWVVIGNIVVYLLAMMDRSGTFLGLLYFSPSLILRGQIWRLVTFLFVPIFGNLFFTAISLYFYYFIGATLEREWGTAKFTLFYLFGIGFNVAAGLLSGFLTGNSMVGLSAQYLNLSMFFAFASLFPNMQVLLFFILPIKIKWLAWVDALYFALQIIMISPAIYKILPVIALLNYFLFFGGEILGFFRSGRNRYGYSRKSVRFRSAAKAAKENKGYLHKCAVCGKTDTEYPDMEFRYCSKCNGYYCYCKDHINNHVHIQ
ncbi:MAG: rhomboid family intramembrane serine protease [Oscillospiraceae bacterium]|mgnify:CR=1 FL=1|nr:rhomboid family intramembrane serine protease [Oscillospiraceae bacterium]